MAELASWWVEPVARGLVGDPIFPAHWEVRQLRRGAAVKTLSWFLFPAMLSVEASLCDVPLPPGPCPSKWQESCVPAQAKAAPSLTFAPDPRRCWSSQLIRGLQESQEAAATRPQGPRRAAPGSWSSVTL